MSTLHRLYPRPECLRSHDLRWHASWYVYYWMGKLLKSNIQSFFLRLPPVLRASQRARSWNKLIVFSLLKSKNCASVNICMYLYCHFMFLYTSSTNSIYKCFCWHKKNMYPSKIQHIVKIKSVVPKEAVLVSDVSPLDFSDGLISTIVKSGLSELCEWTQQLDDAVCPASNADRPIIPCGAHSSIGWIGQLKLDGACDGLDPGHVWCSKSIIVSSISHKKSKDYRYI